MARRNDDCDFSHLQSLPSFVPTRKLAIVWAYMAIEETLTDNKIFVTYDLGGWSKGMNRDVYGRVVDITIQGSRL